MAKFSGDPTTYIRWERQFSSQVASVPMAVNEFLTRLAAVTEGEPQRVVDMYADKFRYEPETAYSAA